MTKVQNDLIFLAIFLFSFFSWGCHVNEKNNDKEKFILIATNDSLNKTVQYSRSDTLLNSNIHFVEEFIKNPELKTIYKFIHFEKKENHSISMVNIITNFQNEVIDTICTPLFTLYVDTAFLYYYDINKYEHTVPAGSTDYIFINKYFKNLDLHLLIMEPIGSSLYRKLCFYDKNFNIVKVVHVILDKNDRSGKGKYYEFVATDVNDLRSETIEYLKKQSYPEMLNIVNPNQIDRLKKLYNSAIGASIKY